MPKFDGSGPWGCGPCTGWGRGGCCGYGMGMMQKFHKSFCPMSCCCEVDDKDTLKCLSEYKKHLEKSLAQVEKEIKELKKSK